jgi:hypothetical protein
MIKTHYIKELAPPLEYIKRGAKNEFVKKIQEWINLWKFYNSGWSHQIIIDGDFGAATENAVKRFQQFRRISVDGIVGPQTWSELVRPMREAFAEIPFLQFANLRTRMAEYARQHVKSNPTEINSNMGPWVRAYMDGNEGERWYWCVGFTETILDHAYSSIGQKYTDHFPSPSYYNCDQVLKYAKENNMLVTDKDLRQGKYIPQKGDMFLNMNPGNINDATHIGIVIECEGTILTTIEGNTDNHIGSRNGGEVCERTRDFGNHLIYIVKLQI